MSMGMDPNQNLSDYNNYNSDTRKGGLQRQSTLKQSTAYSGQTSTAGLMRSASLMDKPEPDGWQQNGGPINGLSGQMESHGSSKWLIADVFLPGHISVLTYYMRAMTPPPCSLYPAFLSAETHC